MAYMDVDPADGPGGGNFLEVTDVFAEASREMEPGSIVAIDGFSLTDAMSAIEIGEPRLDTGMQLENNSTPKDTFDPLTALLPEEICWIIDRSMAYEMEWHASNPLAHTIFTILHVHSLNEIDPDVLPYLFMFDTDPKKPLELVTVVLRAYLCGLLKCCNLAWNELSKGYLLDTEDWQSDKSGISLLEGWPVKAAVARLEAAMNWLPPSAGLKFSVTGSTVPPLWQEALKVRLQLRWTLLLLLNICSGTKSIASEHTEFLRLLNQARQLLSILRAHSQSQSPTFSTHLSPDSPARAAFDPFIARKLDTFIPVRVIEVPSMEQTCSAYERILDGWEELARLSNTFQVHIWDQIGYHQTWSTAPAAQPAYIRSCIQTVFFDGSRVLHRYPQAWVVERLFQETLGISYRAVATRYWDGPGSERLLELEKAVINTLIPHVRNQWANASRRRRFLVKLILDWHVIYDMMCQLVEEVEMDADEAANADVESNFGTQVQDKNIGRNMVSPSPTPSSPSPSHPSLDVTLRNLPKLAILWRLSSIREVILSGFQLELYHPLERPFAYWFASEVVGIHLRVLEGLSFGRAEGQDMVDATGEALREADTETQGRKKKKEKEKEVDSGEGSTGREREYQYNFLSTLRAMCMGMFVLLIQRIPPNTLFSQWEQLRANLKRRYKWAFDQAHTAAYERLEFEPVVLEPDFIGFLKAVGEVQGTVTQGREEDGKRGREGEDRRAAEPATSTAPSSSWLPSSEYFILAETLLQDLLATRNMGMMVDEKWATDRRALVTGMQETCEDLQVHDSQSDPTAELDWSWSLFSRSDGISNVKMKKTPWFPSIRRRDTSAGAGVGAM
ncbi:hypothetical protein D9757_012228 [Collybiopsis confluens]|uniref:Mak10-domain-containing protein n=1 Tax=Collybiopsis confluens TaxID=2823264 RepID=A0A8H5LRZ0_9AGAR|nr:hypothetical protein D9757_012228 [Collybiopsis confluens]